MVHEKAPVSGVLASRMLPSADQHSQAVRPVRKVSRHSTTASDVKRVDRSRLVADIQIPRTGDCSQVDQSSSGAACA